MRRRLKSGVAITIVLVGSFVSVLGLTIREMKNTIYVDGAVEIGKLGAQPVSLTGWDKDVRTKTFKEKRFIQLGAHIKDELSLKYQYDRGIGPTLIHRIPPNQHYIFKDNFEITLKGKDLNSVITYGESILNWLVTRHLDWFRAYQAEKEQAFRALRARRSGIVVACAESVSAADKTAKQGVESGTKKEEGGCQLDRYTSLASRELRSRYQEVIRLATPTEVILNPTGRN